MNGVGYGLAVGVLGRAPPHTCSASIFDNADLEPFCNRAQDVLVQLREVRPARRPLLSANQDAAPASRSRFEAKTEGGARCVSSARRDPRGGRGESSSLMRPCARGPVRLGPPLIASRRRPLWLRIQGVAPFGEASNGPHLLANALRRHGRQVAPMSDVGSLTGANCTPP
jgi:hypothetical protein